MMAQTQYRQNQPTSLQDILNQAALKPGNPIAPPAPSEPSSIDTGSMTPGDRQKLLDILLAPEDPGPAPSVDKPSALAMLFSGLGDAVSGFNAGKTGNPGFQTDYFRQYQNKINQQKADLQRYNEDVTKGRNRSKQRTAEYLLGADTQAKRQAKEDALAATAAKAAEQRRQEDIARETAKDVLKREQHLTDAATKAADEQRQAVRNHKYSIELEQLRNSHKDVDEKKAKQGEKDQKSFSTGVQVALSLVNGNPKENILPFAARVKQGEDPKTVAIELRKQYDDELDAEGVFGNGRDLAHEFFNRKLLEAYQNATAPQP
jgi:hypothetical protein